MRGSAQIYRLANSNISIPTNPESLEQTAPMVKAFSKEVKLEVLMGDVTSESFVDELITYCLSTFGQLNYSLQRKG